MFEFIIPRTFSTDFRFLPFRRGKYHAALVTIFENLQVAGNYLEGRAYVEVWQRSLHFSRENLFKFLDKLEHGDILQYDLDEYDRVTICFQGWVFAGSSLETSRDVMLHVESAAPTAEELEARRAEEERRERKRLQKQEQRSRQAERNGSVAGDTPTLSLENGGDSTGDSGDNCALSPATESQNDGDKEPLSRAGAGIEDRIESNRSDINISKIESMIDSIRSGPVVPADILQWLREIGKNISVARAEEILEQVGPQRCVDILESFPFWNAKNPGAMIEAAMKDPARYPLHQKVAEKRKAARQREAEKRNHQRAMVEVRGPTQSDLVAPSPPSPEPLTVPVGNYTAVVNFGARAAHMTLKDAEQLFELFTQEQQAVIRAQIDERCQGTVTENARNSYFRHFVGEMQKRHAQERQAAG